MCSLSTLGNVLNGTCTTVGPNNISYVDTKRGNTKIYGVLEEIILGEASAHDLDSHAALLFSLTSLNRTANIN